MVYPRTGTENLHTTLYQSVAPWLTLPTDFPPILSEPREYVALGIEYDVGEWQQVTRREKEVKVLECLGLVQRNISYITTANEM